MPRIFSYSQLVSDNNEVNEYADKHSPVVTCAPSVAHGSMLKVNVRIGRTIAHPYAADHRFTYVQLWDLETLLAEAHFTLATYSSSPIMPEVDFYVRPKVSLRLKALAYCNKHGLWESEEVFVKVNDIPTEG